MTRFMETSLNYAKHKAPVNPGTPPNNLEQRITLQTDVRRIPDLSIAVQHNGKSHGLEQWDAA